MALSKPITKINRIQPSTPGLPIVLDAPIVFTNAADFVTSMTGAGCSYAAPFDAGEITTQTLSIVNGPFQVGTISSSVTLVPPAGGVIGISLMLWLTVSGTGNTLDFDTAILRPSESMTVFPKTMDVGLYIVRLWHNGTAWMLTSLEGAF